MYITQKHLPRRTFLRGAGTTLALPLLDAMIPAMRAERLTAAAPVRRLGFVYYPLGVDRERWTPTGEGKSYELSEALAPLAPHKNKFVVLGGLSSDPDRTKAGFHDRAIASFMTGCEPTQGKVHVGISVDQLAALELGAEYPVRLPRALDRRQPGTHGPSLQNGDEPAPVREEPAIRLRATFRRQRQDRPGGGGRARCRGPQQPRRRGRPHRGAEGAARPQRPAQAR